MHVLNRDTVWDLGANLGLETWALVRCRGVWEHNQYSHSVSFPLVNSHSHVLIFLLSFKFCYFVPF